MLSFSRPISSQIKSNLKSKSLLELLPLLPTVQLQWLRDFHLVAIW